MSDNVKIAIATAIGALFGIVGVYTYKEYSRLKFC